MSNKLKWFGVAVAIVVIVGMFNIHRIFAIYWKAENAAVRLSECKSPECEIRGTLRVSPITGEYYVTDADGAEVWFNIKNMDMATYPAAKN